MVLSLLISSFLAVFPTEISGQMLYLLHRGETGKAFHNYLEYSQKVQEHDFELLQRAGIRLLEQGVNSNDLEIQLMCMFGAGVATSHELLPILEKGIHSSELKMQLIALNYLSRLQDDEADLLVLDALSSPSLLIRLEALYQLAQKNHPAVLGHLQSLIVKVPPLARPLFAQIAVHLEGHGAPAYLRQLLTDPDLDVRLETILTVAKAGRDDFLPQIRNLASQNHHSQQESCALALGELKDIHSLKRLRELVSSPRSSVRLAAAIALFELGERNSLQLIEAHAIAGDLFAISALGNLREGRETLKKLIEHEDRDVRLNATLSLLNMGEPLNLKEILIRDKRDLGYVRITSPGRGLKAWKTVPSASHNSKAYPGAVGETLGLKEKILVMAIEFPEEKFLETAKMIIEENQTELIPLLMELLLNRRSDAVVQLLKEGRQKAGAPFIRNYCTLALYNLKEEGQYESELIQWVKQQGNHPLIQFRDEDPSVKWVRGFALTPEETSRFLIDVMQTLAQTQNQAATEALIHAIAYGNPKNRYALAGLLIRTTE